ncbi:ribosomal protein L22p/L17e [Helicosporidium sp. ATCC 50920]|nr:ribosomal protein L22p/L17e [Helicosporidium sp. ATCC 50920]|eukprot:KDD75563.1 ribosomal protein L22p/L17e [Helicosporidium sp. ATCC 50920]
MTMRMSVPCPPHPPSSPPQAQGSDLRVHFKNCRETAAALKGLTLAKAKSYMAAVLARERCIPFTKYASHVGRTSQAKNEGSHTGQGRWPVKSVRIMRALLQNAEANAEAKGLDVDTLYISHIQVNQAPRGRRRTYRAHGRINPFMSSPSHIELILSEKTKAVRAPREGRVIYSRRRTAKHVAQKALGAKLASGTASKATA